MKNNEINTQVVVLGSGPAGYSAAFRCADLGLDTTIVEKYDSLGGVCLNVGCIPSKALLHVANIIEESKTFSKHGIIFHEPMIDIIKIRTWKEKIVNKLTNSLVSMANTRKIKILHGIGKFTSSHSLEISGKQDKTVIHFSNAIIAAGSHPVQLPYMPFDAPQIWDSTDALMLKEIPKRMLIVGGGIIGLEMATIYKAFGTEIDIIEICDQIISAADKDIIRVFTEGIKNKFNLILETKITDVKIENNGVYVSMEGKNAPVQPQYYNSVLVATGRAPNGNNIDAYKAGVEVNKYGFITVDNQLRTNVSHIFAIGDIVGQPMLAHKGIHEGHIAAEIIAGMNYYFDPKVIPSIAYTEPEIAWVGLTEKEAKKQNINFETAIFPWIASGRAIASNCKDGITKIIFDKKTRRIIGGAVVGKNGGELLGEIGLAIEMGCDAEDIALTIHAHPTLYESIRLAAEMFLGKITDLPNNKIKSHL